MCCLTAYTLPQLLNLFLSLYFHTYEFTNIQKVKVAIEVFFENIPNVSLPIVNQIIQDSLILEFNNKKLRVERNRDL